ncbi:MAG: hypothetical protein KAJ62_06755 [Desulfobacteraceae bacterium]|nr:hypothetical protein [Desulfobacteraceae bacterium]
MQIFYLKARICYYFHGIKILDDTQLMAYINGLKSCMAEGQEFLANYMTNFFGVSGFKYESTTFLEIQEALKTIGMEM